MTTILSTKKWDKKTKQTAVVKRDVSWLYNIISYNIVEYYTHDV